MKPLSLFLLLTLFLSPLSTSIAQEKHLDQNSNIMLESIIITLAISEEDKNSSDKIALAQDKVLQALAPFQTKNITRYRYSPLMAISVDQPGLDMLRNLENVISITNDGLNSSQDHPTTRTTKPPCDQ